MNQRAEASVPGFPRILQHGNEIGWSILQHGNEIGWSHDVQGVDRKHL